MTKGPVILALCLALMASHACGPPVMPFDESDLLGGCDLAASTSVAVRPSTSLIALLPLLLLLLLSLVACRRRRAPMD
jgi:hypothetical protein